VVAFIFSIFQIVIVVFQQKLGAYITVIFKNLTFVAFIFEKYYFHYFLFDIAVFPRNF